MLAITRILNKLTAEDKCFTAYDLTRLVREQMPYQVNHEIIKQYLDGLWFMDSLHPAYERTTQRVSDNTFAEVYHPNYKLASSYNKNEFTVRSTVFKPAPNFDELEETATSIIPIDEDIEADDSIRVDSRGRLCIPSDFLKEVKIGAGDRVVLFRHIDETRLLLGKEGSPYIAYLGSDYEELEVYTVDKYCNIRIGNSNLLDEVAAYKIESNLLHNTLKITEH
jgi:bifunctional DNA-binding transcriptional regulator/antitoxin component of YhaV-PrlF toxin-antitoxin module